MRWRPLQTIMERFMQVTNDMNLDRLVLLLQGFQDSQKNDSVLGWQYREIADEGVLVLPLLQNIREVQAAAIKEISRIAQELGKLQGCKDLIEKFDLISDWREHSKSLEAKVSSLTKRNKDLELRLDASLRLLKDSNIAFAAVTNAVENEAIKPYHGVIPPKDKTERKMK